MEKEYAENVNELENKLSTTSRKQTTMVLQKEAITHERDVSKWQWTQFLFPESSFPLTSGRQTRELWEQPCQVCALNADFPVGRIWLLQNGCSQSSRFPTAGQGERRLWERDGKGPFLFGDMLAILNYIDLKGLSWDSQGAN